MSQESVEKEEAFICLQEDFDDLYNQTKIVQGLLTIAERENEKLKQEIAQLETVLSLVLTFHSLSQRCVKDFQEP